MNIYQSFMNQYKLHNKIIWHPVETSQWGHRYVDGVEEGRDFGTQINWRGKVWFWVVKDSIGFLDDKGQDDSGHRIGSPKETQRVQRPTFPPLLFCLRSCLGLHGCHQNHSMCCLYKCSRSLSFSGVQQLFLKLFSVESSIPSGYGNETVLWKGS